MFKSALKLFSKSPNQGSVLPCGLISREPILMISFWNDFQKKIDKILGPIPDHKRAYMVILFDHHRISADRARIVCEDVEIYKLRYPNIEFLFLCNSVDEKLYFDQVHLQSIHCHAAVFLDEHRYQVENTNVKDFQAVYRSDIKPCNRHDLAVDIDDLLLVGNYTPSDAIHFTNVMDNLQTAKFVRPKGRVDSLLTRSKVGVCLGDADGDVFSCVEYLLCGLNVVTTDDYKANTLFYNDDYVTVTRSFSTAINKAVKESSKYNVDPYVIREKTLHILAEHRARFIDFIQDKYDRQGTKSPFLKGWHSSFSHLLGLRQVDSKSSKSKLNLLRVDERYI